jgi:putative peptidoglycan lipid II flippase
VEYRGTPKLGNLKRGVGLVVDLGSAQPVKSVRLALSGNGTAVELRVPKVNAAQTEAPPMGSDKSWVSVAAESKAGPSVTLAPGQSVTTRYVLVYLTSLPKEGNGYRGGVYEVEVVR